MFARICVICFCLTVLCAPLAAHAEPVKIVERSDDELVLVQVNLGRNVLAESLTGYVNKSNLMLPLSQIARALEFSIRTSPREGLAEGWTLDSTHPFTLDVARREVVISGERKSFAEGLAEAHADDIYVDTTLLAEWFQVEFAFSFANQSVDIKPREGVLLPIQQRAEREQVRAGLSRGSNVPEGPFPRMDIPYQLATIPFSDLTVSGGYDKRTYDGSNYSATLLSQGDLFYMHSNVYAAGDNGRDLSELRWTLSRRDPEGKIFQDGEAITDTPVGRAFNDLEIRELALGDINTQQLPLTAFNQQGRGVLISNIPYDRATQYDRTTLQGDLPTGWEVELYRNEELLSFQRASVNGRYEFTDVPLVSGLNIVRLVFYGPFGQKREELRRFFVSPDLTEQGKSHFSMSLSQQSTSSFDALTRSSQTTGSLSGLTPIQTDTVRGKARALFEYEYGLLDNLSLFTNYAHLTTADDVDRDFISTGLATTLGTTYGRIDGAHDLANGGNAVKIAVQDNIGGISLSGEHQQFFDFISEYTESITDPTKRRSTLRADGPLTLPYLPRLNNGVLYSVVGYDSGRETTELTYRLGTSIDRLALSNSLSYRTDSIPTLIDVLGINGLPVKYQTLERQTSGEFILSFPIGRLILRGNVLYDIAPEKQVQTLLTSAEYNFTNRTNAILAVDHQFINDNLTNVVLGLNHRFEKFLLGTNVGYGSDGEYTAGVTLSVSFGEDPRTGKFHFYPEYTAGNGLISARAYHDINGNQLFDEGDMPVENAKFLVNRGGSDNATNAEGNLLIRNVLPDSRSSLTIDEASLGSPYLISGKPGIDLVTRPGVVAMVDYPIGGSGDVEGSVRILTIDDETKDAANVQIQLLQEDGSVFKTADSSFDGYYLFSAVPAGNYTVRVSPEQGARLGFITPPDRQVTISNNETDSKVLDLTIIRIPEEEHNEVSLPG